MNARKVGVATIADIRMEFVAKIAARLGVAVVLASFFYSFFNLWWLSERLGSPHPALSLLFPFIIDGPSVVASALTVALHDRPFRSRAYAWSVLGVFTSLSWLCNAIHAIEKATITEMVPGTLGIVLTVAFAGIPPIGVVLGMHLWAYALRMSVAADQRAEVPVIKVKARQEQQSGGETAPPPEKPKVETQKADAEKPPAKVDDADRTPPVDPADETAPVAMNGTTAWVVMQEEFDRLIAIDPAAKPDASAMHDQLGIGDVKSKATTRRWVLKWWEEHLAKQAPETTDDPQTEPAEDRERETVDAA